MADDPSFEKYGVVQEETRKKEAAQRTPENALRCPVCNAVIKATATCNVYLCPNCGTYPFEPHVKP